MEAPGRYKNFTDFQLRDLQVWNSFLRDDTGKGKKYVTTIHTLVSAILKLSRKGKVPVDRKVYRGLSGMKLDQKWFEPDERGVRGGVELAFLSTSENRETALQYMGKRNGILLEIEVGAVDCGAEFHFLSQYPGISHLSPLPD
jgi:hypothetical protein